MKNVKYRKSLAVVLFELVTWILISIMALVQFFLVKFCYALTGAGMKDKYVDWQTVQLVHSPKSRVVTIIIIRQKLHQMEVSPQ